MKATDQPSCFLLIAALLAIATCPSAFAQTGAPVPVVGDNVNILSPAPGSFAGDVFERQVEPDVAVSVANPARAMAGFITYQTLNATLPASSWCGYSVTGNGGKTWKSNLLPGFPQDTSPEGMVSPLKGLIQCADPVLAGAPPTSVDPAQVYFGGLGMTKGEFTKVFVATFHDPDDGSGTFRYVRTVELDAGNYSFQGAVLDKPSIAVDPPSPGFPQGIIHFSYVVFNGNSADDFRTKVLYVRSTDGGRTFSKPVKANNTFNKNNGTAMARTANGTIYLFWRTFLVENGIQVVSIDRAGTMSQPVTVAGGPNFYAYDQPTLADSFRSAAFPTAVADAGGRLYCAWQESVDGSGNPAPPPAFGPRIVLTSSTDDGRTWAARKAVEVGSPFAFQFQPDLSAGGGIVSLLFWDARRDGRPLNGLYMTGIDRRMEMRVTQAAAGGPFSPSVEVSRYATYANGSVSGKTIPRPGYTSSSNPPWNPDVPIQTAINLPNLKSSSNGTAPFFGDYVGLVSAVEYKRDGAWWRLALQAGDVEARTFYAVFPDTRLVSFPGSPSSPNIQGDWAPYIPGNYCVNPGTRNTKPFFAAISPGLVARWGGTARPLGGSAAFSIAIENLSGSDKHFRLTIVDNKPAENWSFVQPPAPLDSNTVVLQILRNSAFTRGVYFRGANPGPTLPVVVMIEETTAAGVLVANGLSTRVTVTPCDLVRQPWCTSPGSPSYGLSVEPQSVRKLRDGVSAYKLQPHNFGFEYFGFENFGFENFGFENFGFENFGFENFGFENSPPGDYDVSWTAKGNGLLPTSGNTFANVTDAQNVLDSTTDGKPNYMFRLFIYSTHSTPALSFRSSGGCPIPGQSLQDQVISNIPIAGNNSSKQLVASFGFENFGFENFGFENFGFENAPPSDITNAAFVADQEGIKLTLRSYKRATAPILYAPSTENGVVSQGVVPQSLNPGQTTRTAQFDDKQPPVINYSAAPYVFGAWTKENVTLTFSCADAMSGVQTPPVSPRLVTSEGASQFVSATCRDYTNNSASVSAGPINIDRTPPTITITKPAEGASYVLNASVASNFSCADPLAGVAACSGPVSVPTGSVGKNTFIVTATDKAGNTATKTVSYYVVYNYLLSPPKSPANLGSAIPVTWQLADANGAIITDFGTLLGVKAIKNSGSTCGPSTVGTPIIVYNPTAGWTGNSNLRITSSNQFQLNWDTTTAVTLGPGCYTLAFQLKDNPENDSSRLKLTSVELR